jgi:ATP adenylyltransferase
MVGKVLTGNGITACGNGAYSLIGGDDLSDGERDELLEVCRQRLDAFRDVQASYGHREAGCVFCALEGSGRVLLESELALCIADAYPVSEGHSLVIPRRHGADGLELLKLRREQLGAQDASISGWAGLLNAMGGLNSGETTGRTVFHALWHLIPRRTGDDKSPRGGVRGVIKGKQHD